MKEQIMTEQLMCLVCGEDLIYDPAAEEWVCPNCASETERKKVNDRDGGSNA